MGVSNKPAMAVKDAIIEFKDEVVTSNKGRTCLAGYISNVKARPAFMLLVPLLTFCVLCATGIVGVKLGADKFEAEARDSAQSVALDWAASFRLSAERVFTPLVTMAMIIQLNPNVTKLKEVFPETAEQLLKRVNKDIHTVQELQVSPMGVIEMIYPLNGQTDQGLGLDIFEQPALRGGALKTLEAHDIVLNGPLNLVNSNFASIARIPIYIKNSTLNETFGSGRNLPTNCTPPELCFNATSGEKFWGFATAISPMDDIKAGNDSRLTLLKQNHYKWIMTRPYTSTERTNSNLYRPETTYYGDYVFANSSMWPSDQAVASDITIANAVWRVYLEPEEGWRPNWEKGLLATVVIGSAIFAVLVGTIMASWAQQQKLLGEVMASNVQLAETTAKLQEEKLRLDALLVRQYNLVAMLGKSDKSGAKGAKSDPSASDADTSIGSKEGLTLDRIEHMRRQLAVNTNTSLQDIGSIQTLELLGKGTFGKVYKGLWRGTVVAVKTMLLPSNMSGSEKREKMAVMEAAISSSLSHPNVVQTYTYAIRPIRELPQAQEGSEDPTTVATADDASSARVESLRLSSASVPALHSYEVRLVLEFCDKGCLRDALDSGAFLLPGGTVNYLAVLDTAADVAKAMLHLHSLNVLHSDLKCQNVMLATGSADGRGVVGKVGDFGLSLKMDHLETHVSQVYQGTMTHMAPEIMLAGRVSKAADVYSFGITLWELYTGRKAFEGVPRALLGHQITRENKRPKFPPGTPEALRALAERCWDKDWERRPSFGEVLSELIALRAAEPRRTPPVHIVQRTPLEVVDQEAADPFLINGGTSSNGQNTPHRAANGARLSAAAAAAAAGDAPEHQASIYIEHSIDDSDLIVMRTLTDWGEGNSGTLGGLTTSSSNGSGYGSRSRSRPLPQIAEVEGSDAEHDLESGGQGGGGDTDAGQQQQQEEEGQQQQQPVRDLPG